MILYLKNFTDLTEEEKNLVWNERNKESIRSKMYNSDVIPVESHLKWISSLKEKDDRKYFLVYFDERSVGVIDFTDITDDSCEIGDYVFEEYLELGYGILFETVLLRYAFEEMKLNEVHCAVLEENKNVYKTHIKYFGFSPDEKYSSTQKKEGDILRFNGLSLTKENWQKWSNPIVERSLKFFKVEKVIFQDYEITY